MAESNTGNYLRILLVSLFVVLMGLAPSPRVAGKLLVGANQSIAAGDTLAASRALAEASQYYPWRYDLNIIAARLALQAGNPQAAIQYLERSGTLSRLTYDDTLLLAEAYFQSGDSFMAEAIWKHLAELNDSQPVRERLANLYLEREDYPSAIDQLQSLLALNPANIKLYYQIGALYAATDPIKALPFLVQAEQVDPQDAARARALYDKIRTANLFDEPAYTLMIAGRQLANTGEWKLAGVAFQNAIYLQPGYADAWALLGETHNQLSIQDSGSVSVAGLYELDRALQLDSNSVLGNTFMALYWERMQDYSKAQSYLERAIAISPEDPFLHSELGNILAKSGDLPAAQSAYSRAIQINPNDPLFYCLLAQFALDNRIQVREIALPAARQAITLAPHDATSLDVMAQVMLALGDYNSAERYLLDTVQADPGYPQAYLHLGTVYLHLGKPDLARQWLKEAQDSGPGSWISAQAERMLEYYFP